MIIKPQIIGIAGESGVGKSTIAEIVSLFFGKENTIILSTDDLHRWERSNINWNLFTHLNPDANNLDLGDLHIQDLSNNRPIYRSKYSHSTGYFEPPVKVGPKDIIIIEGLHAFYTDISKKIITLKIFIDTDEELRSHWKIIRDTEERGYKYNVVLETIYKRKSDAVKIRDSQLLFADVVITIIPKNKILYLGDKNEKIDLNINIKFNTEILNPELFNFIQNYKL